MITLTTPDSKQVDAVERILYNRMLRNAFIGFVKSAAIAAVVGLAVGGLLSVMQVSLPVLGGEYLALKAAAWFAGVAGSFGAVAGIQSTRDTRRFFQIHEAHNLSPAPSAGRAPALQPEVAAVDEARDCIEFQKKLVDCQEKSAAALQR